MRSQIVQCPLLVALAIPLSVGCSNDGGAAEPSGSTATGGDSGDVPLEGDSTTGQSPPPGDSSTTADASTETPTTGDEGGTTLEPGSSDGDESSSGKAMPSVDCDMVPALPATDMVVLNNIPTSEDFTFDAEGNILGVSIDTQGLHRTTYNGETTMIVPNVSSFGRGIRVLDNGDYLVIAPGNGLRRITPEGSNTLVLSLPDEANGLAIHPNGIAYFTSGNGQLRSFDLDTGDVAVLDEFGSLDGIVFNLDYSKLYYNNEFGTIKQLAFDDEGQPTGTPSNFVTIAVEDILDGMAVDECDNLYVIEMSGTVWRVSPDGMIETAASLPADILSLYSALNFGSGVGGWEADHLYIMSLFGGMVEVDMGVQGKPLPHLP
ncbi:MAG: SMP-30/gluconolactonase/LRE family protein [Nannocystaceae bacterium]|nr:SMP-30/gluconolactonase/LRE family protein [Nannocystaceae bacterium]